MEYEKQFFRKVPVVLLFFCLCLSCSCRKLVPEAKNSLLDWQKDWQGIPLAAINQSGGLNLFLPPAPVFFAATKNEEQVERKETHLGIASTAVERYCQAWEKIITRKFVTEMGLPAIFSLPLPPWATLLGEEDYHETVKYLYSALGEAELSNEHKEQLELLLVFHEQQRQLAEVLNFICQINRGKACSLPEAVRKFRIFHEFQQNFAEYLNARLMPELQLPAQMIDEQLSPFLAAPQMQVPLRCLPSLWMAVNETADKPISAEGKNLCDWRALQPTPFRYAAIWEDGQTGLPQSEEGFTWLVMSFASPQQEKNSSFHLLFLPLPEQCELFLNGVGQPITPNQALVLEVNTAASTEDEQLIALRFPNSSLGIPMWPPWLVKNNVP